MSIIAPAAHQLLRLTANGHLLPIMVPTDGSGVAEYRPCDRCGATIFASTALSTLEQCPGTDDGKTEAGETVADVLSSLEETAKEATRAVLGSTGESASFQSKVLRRYCTDHPQESKQLLRLAKAYDTYYFKAPFSFTLEERKHLIVVFNQMIEYLESVGVQDRVVYLKTEVAELQRLNARDEENEEHSLDHHADPSQKRRRRQRKRQRARPASD